MPLSDTYVQLHDLRVRDKKLSINTIMPLYSYADITLSSSFPLPDLPAVPNSKDQSPDIKFQLLDSQHPEPAESDWIHHFYTPSEDISISLAKTEKGFLFRFPSLADFIISEDGCEIGSWQTTETDAGTLSHLLLDQVLPRLLSHQGKLVLHASALTVESKAIAFVGETGEGKSTLAASLHLAGYPLLTDDGLLIQVEEGCVKALPCYQGLRLWPQSIAALFKELPSCEPMASYSEKNRIRLPPNNKNSPMELAALFVLEKPGREETASIQVSPLSQRDGCMALIRNSFQLDVSNHEKTKDIFSAASRVAEQLPVFSLSYPRDFSCLPDVHEKIMQQMKSL